MSDYFYLCGHCGEITDADEWAMFHYTEGGDRREPEPNETDPVLECPRCLYEFTDDDGGPPMYDGTRETCEKQRVELLSEVNELHGYDYAEDWAEVKANPAVPR